MEEKGDDGYRGDEGKRVFLSDGVMKHKSLMKNRCRRRRQAGFGWCLSPPPLHLSLVCPILRFLPPLDTGSSPTS